MKLGKPSHQEILGIRIDKRLRKILTLYGEGLAYILAILDSKVRFWVKRHTSQPLVSQLTPSIHIVVLA